MKVPQSVRVIYDEIRPRYIDLKEKVDRLVRAKISSRWHYESRIKTEESFAQKLETGREEKPNSPEDLFACTVVVENRQKIEDAVILLGELFKESYRRPKDSENTHLRPENFAFDDLRLYMQWVDEESLPPTGLNGLVFEVQVKTFLQHAWGIATHDLLYKSEDVDWGLSRVAFQVKAMLENAELSISEVGGLTKSSMLNRTNSDTRDTKATIAAVKERWTDSGSLPEDVKRLADNIENLRRVLRLNIEDVWSIVDAATNDGRGANVKNLSPYAAIVEALVESRGDKLFKPLENSRNKAKIFVPMEIDIDSVNPRVLRSIVRSQANSCDSGQSAKEGD